MASIILRNVIIAVARGARACLSRAQFSPLSSLPPGTCASVGTVISKSLLDFDEYRVCRISCKENCGGDSQKSRKRVRFAFTEENERERESIYGLIVAQGYREPFESFLPGPRARDRDFEEEEEGSENVDKRNKEYCLQHWFRTTSCLQYSFTWTFQKFRDPYPFNWFEEKNFLFLRFIYDDKYDS